jgi:LysR family transcriptional regulator, nitrogen assimilation regulatory protein
VAPLLLRLAEKHLDIVLNVSDNLGIGLSDLVVSGRLDMALISSIGPIKVVRLDSLFEEAMMLVAHGTLRFLRKTASVWQSLCFKAFAFCCRGRYRCLRRLVEASFAHARIVPFVVGEIESIVTLTAALEAGLGATLVPKSTARIPKDAHWPPFEATPVRVLGLVRGWRCVKPPW